MNRREIMKLVSGSAVGAVASTMVSPGVSEASDSTGFKRRRVTTADGVSLNVIDAGNRDGPVILFVHGISQGWQSWIKQLSDPGLRSAFRLVAFDLRGHGESEGAQGALDEDGLPFDLLPSAAYNTGDAATTAQLWANDVEAVIDGLNLHRSTLVGWSYGGVVVQDYMFTKGGLGQARRVLFVASNAALTSTGNAAGSLLFTPESGAVAGATLPGNSNVDVAAGLTGFVELCFEDDVPGRPPPQAADIQAAVAFNIRAAPETRLAIFGRTFDYRPFLAGLPHRTRSKIQAITPLSDRILQSATENELWAESSVNNEVIPDEGHLYLYRNPDEFNATLAAYVLG